MRLIITLLLVFNTFFPLTAQDNLLADVNDFLYQTHEADLYRISHLKYDMLITDYSFDGTDSRAYNADQVNGLKFGMGDPTIVFATMSLSIAETHRWYWTDGELPEWLDLPDEWEETDRYLVDINAFEWHEILYTYLDKILEAEFDGIYLTDLPDSDPQILIDLIFAMADYSRVQDEEFLVLVEGGLSLPTDNDEYLDVIDGIMIEGIFYGTDGENIPADDQIDALVTNLTPFLEADKLVLLTAFTTDDDQISDHYMRALELGAVPFATVETLDQMTINRDFLPD